VHLTFRQLQVFEAVARLLSYTRAAEELFLTQPAVSMQIKQMEDQVGMPLFEQMGKRIFLTEAGQEVYHYSRAIAQQLEELEMVMASLKGLRGGKLKIAIVSTAQYVVPNLLGVFCRRYPGVTVSLDVTNRETLLYQLAENVIDLAVMGQPPTELGFEAAAFMQNPLVIIAPPQHSLVGQSQIPLARLQEETFLVREPGSGTRIAMERFFSERGVRLKTGMEVSSNEAIKQSVQAGLGLGLVSMHTLELELEYRRLAVLDVEHLPIERHWHIVHRQGKRFSQVGQVFKEFILRESAQHLSRPA
jgi:DNA-binding transcriptional LysR family regulator